MTARSADVVLGGRYRLLEPIAAGGMGTVWRAEDERLGRRVAVKVLNEALADEPRFLERFRREAQAAAALSHHNIAGVFDYGEDDSRPYIVMELVEGQTLAARLARKGALSPDEAAVIAADVADALAEAHAAGVVHRDVKPANVILSAKGQVKVTDFGIASSSRTTNLTATGMVMGSARYLSPEQARGERATPASDVYALGVLLYEMLTGAPPFDHSTPVATAMAHVQETPRPIRELRPKTPAWLAELAEACLEKDPAARPQSAAALAAQLRGQATDPDATAVIQRDPTAVLPVADAAAPVAAPARARPERGRPSRRWLLPVVLVLLSAGALMLITRLASNDPVAPPLVTVPGFEGLTRAEARARAEARGLEVTFVEQESPEPRGTVLAQTPERGERVARGSTIALVVSSGPPLTTVPRLVGLDSEEAVLEALAAANLEFGQVVPVEGEVGIVGSDPPEGARVPEGTEVDVLVGRGDGDGDDGDGGGNEGGKGKGKGNGGDGD